MPKIKTMVNLSALMGFSSIGGSIFKARLARRLMKDIAGVIALAVATGFMAGALLIGVFYLVYQELVHSGLEPLAAVVFLLVLGAMAVYSLLRVLRRKLRALIELPARAMPGGADIMRHVYTLVDSFLDGLSGRQRRK